MRTKFNTLSQSETYRYNATRVADSSWVSKLKHYYIFDRKKNTVEKASLEKKHFDSKYYRNVLEGSQRWWLLELRKSDFNFMEKDKFSYQSIYNYEKQWNTKITEWYFFNKTGVEKSEVDEIGSAEKISRYKLVDKTCNKKILTVEEAVKIGLNEDGTPRFFKVFYDESGEIRDVELNIKASDLVNREGLEKYSQRWWLLERMRYDWGNDQHPISAEFGMVGGDWKGIEYKWMNGINNINSNYDLLKYHQRGWIQWVQANYASLASDITNDLANDRVKRDNNAYNHNLNKISAMTSDELSEVAKNCPEYILTHMSPQFYGQAIMMVISLLDRNNRIAKTSAETISKIYKNVIPSIKTYATTPKGCRNIQIEHVYVAINAVDPKGNIDIAKIIALKVAQYNMLSGRKAGMLTSLLSEINIYPARREDDYSVFEKYLEDNNMTQFEWYSRKGSLNDLMAYMDKDYEEIKSRYDLW